MVSFESIMEPIVTNISGGTHQPLLLLVVMVVMGALTYFLLYNQGNKTFNNTGRAATPFFSGSPIPVKELPGVGEEEIRFKASNIYWGFAVALRNYYRAMYKLHSGKVNDYTFFYFATVVAMVVFLTLWGVL